MEMRQVIKPACKQRANYAIRSLELNVMPRTVRDSTLVRQVAAETGVLWRLRTISLLLA